MLIIMKTYLIILLVLSIMYGILNMCIYYSRVKGKQREFYGDIVSSKIRRISVLIPMKNESAFVSQCIERILEIDSDKIDLEIIPIDYGSTDGTGEILDNYRDKYKFIKPLHCTSSDLKGVKASNAAVNMAKGDIIVVMDCKIMPASNVFERIANAFENPSVGFVNTRIIANNSNRNVLTRFLSINLSGLYQCIMQGSFNLEINCVMAKGITGYRKDILKKAGGFTTEYINNDICLKYKLITAGYSQVYDNYCESYGSVYENSKEWEEDIKQEAFLVGGSFFQLLGSILFSRKINFRNKICNVLQVVEYIMPILSFFGFLMILSMILTGRLGEIAFVMIFIVYGFYCGFAKSNSFIQIFAGQILDGVKGENIMWSFGIFYIFFTSWYTAMGIRDVVAEFFRKVIKV